MFDDVKDDIDDDIDIEEEDDDDIGNDPPRTDIGWGINDVTDDTIHNTKNNTTVMVIIGGRVRLSPVAIIVTTSLSSAGVDNVMCRSPYNDVVSMYNVRCNSALLMYGVGTLGEESSIVMKRKRDVNLGECVEPGRSFWEKKIRLF